MDSGGRHDPGKAAASKLSRVADGNHAAGRLDHGAVHARFEKIRSSEAYLRIEASKNLDRL